MASFGCVCGGYGTEVALVGEYSTRLCPECRNLWYLHCKNEFNELNRQKVSLAVAIQNGSEDTALAIQKKIEALTDYLHAMAEAWVVEQKKQHEDVP